jgi:SNF2 family DNA or RNA helicase
MLKCATYSSLFRLVVTNPDISGQDKEAVFQSASQGKLDVVLTSYDTFKQQFTAINEVRWSCVIFDEAHKIKNKSSKLSQICKRLKTVRRFGLTGTVMQNSFEELVRSGLCPLAPTALDRLTRRYNKWNLVDVIWPAYFGNIDYFKKQYINPIRSGAMQDASSGQISLGRVAAQALADKLKKIVLRRTKKHIMHQLPSKEDNVVFCPMTQLQREAYSRVLQSRSYEVLRRNSSVCECDSGKLAARCCKKESLISGDEWRQMVLPAITQLQKLASRAISDTDTDFFLVASKLMCF